MANRNYIKVDPVKDGILPHRVGIADVLSNSGTDFSLFTAALLFTHGGFDRDPVVEFASYYSEVSLVRPVCLDLQHEHEFFFRGLGSRPAPRTAAVVNWDKRIYGIAGDAAADCFSFLGGIGWSNPKTGFFGRTFSYVAEIPDPTSDLEMLSVRLFGVVGNNFVVFIDPASVVPAARLINTNKPLDVLQSLGADIETYKRIVNPGENNDDV